MQHILSQFPPSPLEENDKLPLSQNVSHDMYRWPQIQSTARPVSTRSLQLFYFLSIANVGTKPITSDEKWRTTRSEFGAINCGQPNGGDCSCSDSD